MLELWIRVAWSEPYIVLSQNRARNCSFLQPVFVHHTNFQCFTFLFQSIRAYAYGICRASHSTTQGNVVDANCTCLLWNSHTISLEKTRILYCFLSFRWWGVMCDFFLALKWSLFCFQKDSLASCYLLLCRLRYMVYSIPFRYVNG